MTVVQARDLLDCDTTFGFNLVSKNYSDPDCKISMLCSEELDLNLGECCPGKHELDECKTILGLQSLTFKFRLESCASTQFN